MSLGRLQFIQSCCVDQDVLHRHVAHAKTLGLPYVRESERPPLAVVGGGSSLVPSVETLRDWRGDIWACGSPYPWLRQRGIKATYFCIDPLAENIPLASGSKAIVSTTTHPGVFDVVESAEVFDLLPGSHGPTTATAVPYWAMFMGYRDVTFFGCDSSFEASTHVYKDEDWECHLWVTCNGKEYRTKPQLLMQAEYLATTIRLLPDIFKEESGGLLRAMVSNLHYEAVAGNKAMHKLLGVA